MQCGCTGLCSGGEIGAQSVNLSIWAADEKREEDTRWGAQDKSNAQSKSNHIFEKRFQNWFLAGNDETCRKISRTREHVGWLALAPTLLVQIWLQGRRCSSFLSIHSLAYICSISFSSPPILGRQLSQRLSKSISTVSNSLCTASAQLHPCFLPCRTQ